MRLEEILGPLEEEHADRVRRSLALLHRQAVCSARLQGRVDTLTKQDNSPVTVIDLLHQAQVQQLISVHFPPDGLICEEPRSLQEEVLEEALQVSRLEYGLALPEQVLELPTAGEAVTWVLDPIDGTKGFLGRRCFAIAVGYFVRGRPYFGALAVPVGDPLAPRSIDGTLSFAIAGRGAWITPAAMAEEGEWTLLRTELWADGDLRVAVSLAHGGRLAERLESRRDLQLVKLDSQAKYVAVAAGEIDAYLRSARDDGHPDVVWDHMPAALVAQEAGCTGTHFDAQPVEFAVQEAVAFRGGVVCCRPSSADRLRQRLQFLTAPI